MNPTGPRQYTHEAASPAILVFLKDGKVQKAVVYDSTAHMVYVREEGRGGFGIVPTETATDFLAFDDMLTLEPEQIAAAQEQIATENKPSVGTNGATVLAITVKAQ